MFGPLPPTGGGAKRRLLAPVGTSPATPTGAEAGAEAGRWGAGRGFPRGVAATGVGAPGGAVAVGCCWTTRKERISCFWAVVAWAVLRAGVGSAPEGAWDGPASAGRQWVRTGFAMQIRHQRSGAVRHHINKGMAPMPPMQFMQPNCPMQPMQRTWCSRGGQQHPALGPLIGGHGLDLLFHRPLGRELQPARMGHI